MQNVERRIRSNALIRLAGATISPDKILSLYFCVYCVRMNLSLLWEQLLTLMKLCVLRVQKNNASAGTAVSHESWFFSASLRL